MRGVVAKPSLIFFFHQRRKSMDELLDFYEVSADYISYLLRFDSKVPRVDYSAIGRHDKFLCGIVLSVNDQNYFAPISSFITPQRTNIIIKDEKGEPLSSIRFSFMIPVPPNVVTVKSIKDEPSPQYRRLLDWELRFCQNNSRAIHRLAKFVYNMVTGNRDPIMVKNCCDFKKLEAACAEYAKNAKSVDGCDFLTIGNI
jgi:protein AbiQ